MPTLNGRGVRLDLPAGWDGRIYRREPVPPEQTFTVVHAANFSLPPDCGDYGNGAVDIMSAHNILMCLLEFEPRHAGDPLFARSSQPQALPPQRFDRTTLQHGLPGQVGAQQFFSASERAWSLFVVLGHVNLLNDLVPVVNDVLGSLRIEAYS